MHRYSIAPDIFPALVRASILALGLSTFIVVAVS